MSANIKSNNHINDTRRSQTYFAPDMLVIPNQTRADTDLALSN